MVRIMRYKGNKVPILFTASNDITDEEPPARGCGVMRTENLPEGMAEKGRMREVGDQARNQMNLEYITKGQAWKRSHIYL